MSVGCALFLYLHTFIVAIHYSTNQVIVQPTWVDWCKNAKSPNISFLQKEMRWGIRLVKLELYPNTSTQKQVSNNTIAYDIEYKLCNQSDLDKIN